MTGRTPAEREARRTAVILAAAQAIVGSAAVVAFSLGAIAGHYLLDADKSLATAPITGFNLGVALGAIPAAWVIRRLGQRNGFQIGTPDHGAWRDVGDVRAVPVEFLDFRRRFDGYRARRRIRAAIPLRRSGQCAAGIQGARHLLRACRRRLHRGHRPADRHLHARSACACHVRRSFRGDPGACGGRRCVAVVPARAAEGLVP